MENIKIYLLFEVEASANNMIRTIKETESIELPTNATEINLKQLIDDKSEDVLRKVRLNYDYEIKRFNFDCKIKQVRQTTREIFNLINIF